MKQDGKWRFAYFLIKRILILLIEAILILLSYIGNLVNRPLLIIVIFIVSKIRIEWSKGLRLREETGILKGYLKGNVLQELAEKEGMTEVIYYPYSGIIKEVKVARPKTRDNQVEVWHQWNKRYEYMQANHIEEGKAFDLVYEGLKRMSNGKIIYRSYGGKAELQKLQFQELDNKEMKEKILNEKEVYLIISRPEDKLVLDLSKGAEEQMLERKVWDGQLYALMHFFGGNNVEIMGITEIKTMKWLMKECRSRGYDVQEI